MQVLLEAKLRLQKSLRVKSVTDSRPQRRDKDATAIDAKSGIQINVITGSSVMALGGAEEEDDDDDDDCIWAGDETSDYCNLGTRCEDEGFATETINKRSLIHDDNESDDQPSDQFVFEGERDDFCEQFSTAKSRKENFEFDQFLSQKSLVAFPLLQKGSGSTSRNHADGQLVANAIVSKPNKLVGKVNSGMARPRKVQPRKILQNLPAHLKATPYYNSIKHELDAVRAEFELISSSNNGEAKSATIVGVNEVASAPAANPAIVR